VAAWFRFTNIETVDAGTFCRAFGEIFVGEGTLFPIPLKGSGNVLLGRTNDELTLRGHKILHLSDLHFGADFGFPFKREGDRHPISEMLRRGLKDFKEEIGMVIVSGDLTTKGNTDELQGLALRFLNDLVSQIGLDKEFVAIVPGNHDYKLDHWKPQNYEHQLPFSNFMKLFYGPSPFQVPSMRRFRLPDGRTLQLLMMDSVKLRSKELSNYGFIEWEAYEDLLDATGREEGILRIAVVHHHLVPAPREEWVDPEYPRAGLSFTLDSGAVVEGLQAHGFRIVLHGHQHVPGVVKIARGSMQNCGSDLVGLDRELFVVAGGSAGAGPGRLTDAMRDNCFNILHLGSDAISVECQRYTSNSPPRRWFSATIPGA
jgi:predicted phosphodiesterase